MFTSLIEEISKKKLLYLASVLVVLVFIFFRFYLIFDTLVFFGDIGRDFLTLERWSSSFKPPLVGPQTSTISFNQSAFYFYLLFPFFLITGKSYFTTVIACASVYIIFFILGLFFFRKEPAIQWTLISFFLLVSIHPQFIAQHRYVWNPSLVTPFLAASVLLFFTLRKKWRNSIGFLSIFFLVVAIGMSYSVLPIAVPLVVAMFLSTKKYFKIIIFGIISLLIVNGGTIAYELRHNFLLTRSIFSQEFLQVDTVYDRKISLLETYITGVKNEAEMRNISKYAFIFTLLVYFFTQKKSDTSFLFILIATTIAGFIVTIYTPFEAHEHYIFGVTTLLLLIVAFTPLPYRIGLIGLCCIFWLQPSTIGGYFIRPPLSLSQKIACVQKMCSDLHEPVFINVNGTSHNHQALEYIFLFEKMHCPAVSTHEFSVQQPQKMIVINETVGFNPEKTGYYELSQFGERKPGATYTCGDKLSAQVFIH